MNDIEATTESLSTDGLADAYDVILVGTGLVQSIAAAAIARTQTSVLHVDAADYYGGLEAVWTFPYVLHRGAQPPYISTPSHDDESKIALSSELEDICIDRMERPKFRIETGSNVQTPYGEGYVKTMPDSNNSMAIVLSSWTLANGSHPTLFTDASDLDRIRTVQEEVARQILDEHSRSLALDITPYLLFSNGPAVSGLLTSGVADYLEFKSLEGVYYYEDQRLSVVPCSKNDVFSSTLLSPMDKRRLMKFLQTALDFATAEATEHKVESWNELHLNQGRSLSRPQNKTVANSDLTILQKLCQEDKLSFEEYLRETQKLPPSLTKLVRYALALEETGESATIGVGIHQLCAHMMALGQFGTTAFLLPMYGSGELSQAFCRSAAVYGGTYLLRRAATSIMIRDNAVQGIELSAEDGAKQLIKTQHVIVADGSVPSIKRSGKVVVRRIGIAWGKPLKSQQQQRHVVIVPPESFPNQPDAVQCLLVDESAQVAPVVAKGCTVLHVTTTVDSGLSVELSNQLLDRVAASIFENDHETADEVFYTNFRYHTKEKDVTRRHEGLHVIHRPRPMLTADTCFEQAKDIFEKVCPGHSFLEVSKGMKDTIREALGDDALDKEEDDEARILETATGMLS